MVVRKLPGQLVLSYNNNNINYLCTGIFSLSSGSFKTSTIDRNLQNLVSVGIQKMNPLSICYEPKRQRTVRNIYRIILVLPE